MSLPTLHILCARGVHTSTKIEIAEGTAGRKLLLMLGNSERRDDAARSAPNCRPLSFVPPTGSGDGLTFLVWQPIRSRLIPGGMTAAWSSPQLSRSDAAKFNQKALGRTTA